MQGRSLNGKVICFKPLKEKTAIGLPLNYNREQIDRHNKYFPCKHYVATQISYHAIT